MTQDWLIVQSDAPDIKCKRSHNGGASDISGWTYYSQAFFALDLVGSEIHLNCNSKQFSFPSVSSSTLNSAVFGTTRAFLSTEVRHDFPDSIARATRRRRAIACLLPLDTVTSMSSLCDDADSEKCRAMQGRKDAERKGVVSNLEAQRSMVTTDSLLCHVAQKNYWIITSNSHARIRCEFDCPIIGMMPSLQVSHSNNGLPLHFIAAEQSAWLNDAGADDARAEAHP